MADQMIDPKSGLTYHRIGFIEAFLAHCGQLSDGALLGAAEQSGITVEELAAYAKRNTEGDLDVMLSRIAPTRTGEQET